MLQSCANQNAIGEDPPYPCRTIQLAFKQGRPLTFSRRVSSKRHPKVLRLGQELLSGLAGSLHDVEQLP